MNSYRFNQVAMAVLAALLLFFGTRTIINIYNEPPEAEHPASAPPAQQAAAPKAPQSQDQFLAALQKASVKKGEADAAVCKACHTLNKGGPNSVGPNLWNIVDRPVGSHPGYAYSEPVKKHGGKWTFEQLDEWLTSPAKHIPGTKMAIFPGVPQLQKRADIIAYLDTLSDHPVPLPKPSAKSAAAPAASSGAAPKPQASAAGGEPEILKLLPTASADKGKQDVSVCKMCHNMDKGGPNMVGPNLYGVVDRPVGKHPGFDYSPAVKNHGGKWTYVALDEMIDNPAKHIPGTKMAMFPGIPNAKKRADIIAYLRTLSPNPAPLPGGSSGGAAKPAAPAPAKASDNGGASAPAESSAPAAAPSSTPAPAATPPASNDNSAGDSSSGGDASSGDDAPSGDSSQ